RSRVAPVEVRGPATRGPPLARLMVRVSPAPPPSNVSEVTPCRATGGPPLRREPTAPGGAPRRRGAAEAAAAAPGRAGAAGEAGAVKTGSPEMAAVASAVAGVVHPCWWLICTRTAAVPAAV